MAETPLTPPFGGPAVSQGPAPLPDQQLTDAGQAVANAQAQIAAAAINAMWSAAQDVTDCETAILNMTLAGLQAAQQLLADVEVSVEVPILAMLGWAAQLLEQLGCPPITPEELGQLAGGYPWPGEYEQPSPGQLGSLGNPPASTIPITPGAGGWWPLPDWPQVPAVLLPFIQPIPGAVPPKPKPKPKPGPPGGGVVPPFVVGIPVPIPGAVPPIPPGGPGVLPPWVPPGPGIPPGGGTIPFPPPGGGITPPPDFAQPPGGGTTIDFPPMVPPGIPPPGGVPPPDDAAPPDFYPPPSTVPPSTFPPIYDYPPGGGPGGFGGGNGGGGGGGLPPPGGGGPAGCPPPVINVTCPPPNYTITVEGSTVTVSASAIATAEGEEVPGGGVVTAGGAEPGGAPPTIFAPGEPGPEQAFKPLVLDAADPDFCVAVAGWAASIQAAGNPLWKLLWGTTTGEQVDESAIIPGMLLGKWLGVQLVSKQFVKALWALSYSVLQPGVAWSNCDSQAYDGLYWQRGVLDFVERWIGVRSPEAQNKLQHLIGQVCPSALPTQEQVNGAYLRAEIDYDQWTCWTRANGFMVPSAELAMSAGKTKPNVNDNLSLWLRNLITEAELTVQLRGNGVLAETDVERYKALTAFIPPYTDLVRMMVRDTFDEAVVKQFQYDAQFDLKFTGQAKAWCRAQGISEDVMRHIWRAHWRLPSPTQAFEMLHRLRPLAVDDELTVTKADVKKLLEVDDLAPFWQDRLIAISYRPIRRIDLRRGYFLGAYQETETKLRLQDLGYDEETAEAQFQSWRFERREWAQNRPYFRKAKVGAVTTEELAYYLNKDGITGELQQELLELAQQWLLWRRREICLRGLRRRVITGMVSQDMAIGELVQDGYTGVQANNLTSGWMCELKAKGRFATAAMLCRWADMGLVGTVEMAQALARLGYEAPAISRIIAECQLKAKARQQREQERLMQKQLSAQEKAAAKLERQQRQAQAEFARAARAAAQLKKDEERVQKTLVKATRVIAKASGDDADEVRKEVDKQHVSLQVDKGFSRQGAADLIYELAVVLKHHNPSAWKATLAEFVISMPKALPVGPPVGTGNGQSANGSAGGVSGSGTGSGRP